MGERERVCVACNSPSPGPAKRLYYQHRDFGPFFPILEEQRHKANNFLFSGGRALVCTGCANHLLRQWSAYEQKWTPLPRRTYSLLSEEREAKKTMKTNNSISSELSHNTRYDTSPARSTKGPKWPGQAKILQVFNPDVFNNDSLSQNGEFSSSFITEGASPFRRAVGEASPFRRAVKQVTKQNTRALNETSKLSDVVDTVLNQNRKELDSQTSNRTVAGSEILPRKKSPPLALLSLPNDNLRSKVREELQENVEVMIRKLAEIQHVENMRRYEHELQEAAQRICRAQDREGDIDRICRNLKRQLQEELMFRDTSRVLRDSEQAVVRSANAAIQTSEPIVNSNGVGSVMAAKKVGSEWKGKMKKTRNKKEGFAPQRQTPLRTQSETLPRDIVQDPPPQPRSAQNIDAVLRELEKEREWRKKTENAMIRQQEMIDELRKGIHGDVQRLIDEQNHRYQELKETLVSYENAKKNQTRSLTRTERKPSSDDRTKAMQPWTRDSDDVTSIHHGNHSDDQDETDDDDDSHDEDSSPRTPEYYIH